jgi:30S ribosomal protein S31
LKKQDAFVSCFFFKLFQSIKINIMGRGDIKTKKGKTFAGSFGKSRPAKPAAAKKVAAKKAEEKKA